MKVGSISAGVTSATITCNPITNFIDIMALIANSAPIKYLVSVVSGMRFF
jgi:hypothetical protein